MSNKEIYTKIFLAQSGKTINETALKDYMPLWWKNTRVKEEGGLRLTDEGFRYLKEELDLVTYDIPYPNDFKFSTNVLIWLDNFIDCPYYLGSGGMIVTNEKKALELHLFSGDIRKYGLTKALKRQKKDSKIG